MNRINVICVIPRGFSIFLLLLLLLPFLVSQSAIFANLEYLLRATHPRLVQVDGFLGTHINIVERSRLYK